MWVGTSFVTSSGGLTSLAAIDINFGDVYETDRFVVGDDEIVLELGECIKPIFDIQYENRDDN